MRYLLTPKGTTRQYHTAGTHSGTEMYSVQSGLVTIHIRRSTTPPQVVTNEFVPHIKMLIEPLHVHTYEYK